MTIGKYQPLPYIVSRSRSVDYPIPPGTEWFISNAYTEDRKRIVFNEEGKLGVGMLDLLTYHDSLSEDPLSVPLMFDPRCEVIRVAPIVQCLSLSPGYPAYCMKLVPGWRVTKEQPMVRGYSRRMFSAKPWKLGTGTYERDAIPTCYADSFSILATSARRFSSQRASICFNIST